MDFIEPMLCKAVNMTQFKIGNWYDYIAQLKIDGWRAIATKSGSDIAIYSRTGKDRAGHLPHLVNAFQKYLPDGVYDGEVVFMNPENGVVLEDQFIPDMSFNKTARIMGSSEAVSLRKQQTFAGQGAIYFVMFDILEDSGGPYLDSGMLTRSILVKDIAEHVPYVISAPMWEIYDMYNLLDAKTRHVELFNSVVDNRLEGLVLKNVYGKYVPGGRPSNNQYKIKAEKFFDVVVSGYTWAKEGKFEGLIGALKFGVYDDKFDFIEIGQTSGMNDTERLMWTQYLTTKSDTPPRLRVIEIKCNDLTDKNETGYGTPRHPQYIRLRDDKKPQDCMIGQFKV